MGVIGWVSGAASVTGQVGSSVLHGLSVGVGVEIIQMPTELKDASTPDGYCLAMGRNEELAHVAV